MWLLVLLIPGVSRSGSLTITSDADTTLSENYPSNNFGGLKFFNSGTTQNHTRNRGLLHFDLAGALPVHSRIIQGNLTLEVRHVPSADYAFADFGLYRMLRAWGEGKGTSPTNSNNAGAGALALTNEATWYASFAYTPNWWSIPGAAPIHDFSPVASSSQTIYGIVDSPYTFAATPLLVSDLQGWLDQPEANFGWALVCQSEEVNFTARRFASHEDPDYAPQLQLDYLVVPVFEAIARAGNGVELHFQTRGDQAYEVQFSPAASPAAGWTTLTNLAPSGVSGPVVVADTVGSAERFYRLLTH